MGLIGWLFIMRVGEKSRMTFKVLGKNNWENRVDRIVDGDVYKSRFGVCGVGKN
jgi:hypothetical protein